MALEGTAEVARSGEAPAAGDGGDGEVDEAAVGQVAAGPVQAAGADVGGDADGMMLLAAVYAVVVAEPTAIPKIAVGSVSHHASAATR